MIEIDSELRVLGLKMPDFPDEVVKNEPMLFNCDMAAASRQGGVITKAFLGLLPLDWHDCPVVVDTRVHMLMPGWYPCIPGWHHDDVPRTRPDGQPSYEHGQDRSWHVMALVNARLAPTTFALGKSRFPHPPHGITTYELWHGAVELKLRQGELKQWQLRTGNLVLFDDRCWHRGSEAVGTGWRWFGRVSRYFDAAGREIARRNPRTCEVRRQVQVYLPAVNAGW